MRCEDCGGSGSVEYDAGLLTLGCKTCEMTGKVGEALTKEEFLTAYAFRNDMTVAQVEDMGLDAVPCECVQGWSIENVTNKAPDAPATPPDDTPVPEEERAQIEAANEAADVRKEPIAEPEPTEEEQKAPTPFRAPKPGQYYCGKCSANHTEKSKIGKRHIAYVAAPPAAPEIGVIEAAGTIEPTALDHANQENEKSYLPEE